MAKKKESKQAFCVKRFCIKSPYQGLLLYTGGYQAKQAKDAICRTIADIHHADTWKTLYKAGYRVVKIEVREV